MTNGNENETVPSATLSLPNGSVLQNRLMFSPRVMGYVMRTYS